MIRKLSISAMALAAVGMAAPAMAQETVNIEVTVQSIAELVVENATGTMLIDDSSDSNMGNPSSNAAAPGYIEDLATGNWALIRLNTNDSVQGVEFTYDKVDGIRPNPTLYYGEAIGTGSGNTLGVWPTIINVDEDANGGAGALEVNATNQILRNDGSAPTGSLLRREQTANAPGATATNYGNGSHVMAVGVGANWSNTLPSEPVFAEPDDYVITLTATIVP